MDAVWVRLRVYRRDRVVFSSFSARSFRRSIREALTVTELAVLSVLAHRRAVHSIIVGRAGSVGEVLVNRPNAIDHVLARWNFNKASTPGDRCVHWN